MNYCCGTTNNTCVQSCILDDRRLTQLILDDTVIRANGGLNFTQETICSVERLPRNLCFALYKLRSEILGSRLREFYVFGTLHEETINCN